MRSEVCLRVRVCVTANLGNHAKRRQMMGTNGISGVRRSLKKKVFSQNMRRSKVMVSFAYREHPRRHSSALELAFSTTENSKVV